MRKIIYNLQESDIEKYYLEITKDRDARFLLHEKVLEIDKHLKNIDESLNFKDIILADFSKLLNYVNIFESHIEQKIKPKILQKYNGDEKQYVIDFFEARNDKKYKYLSKLDEDRKKKISKEISKKICSVFYGIESILYENGTIFDSISDFFMKYNDELNIKTCFYCNIDFVNVFHDKKKNHFTLDHILPKKKYPYLSISLFNLIPSCYSCNSKFKGQKEFEKLDILNKISPSSEVFELDTLLNFRLNYDLNDINFADVLKKNIEIENFKVELINTSSFQEIDTFLEMFALKCRYEYHKNISFEMIEKRKKYSDSQIDEIEKLFFDEGILIDKETFKRHIFGSVIFEKENTNEPFEKYKKNIAKQLGLI